MEALNRRRFVVAGGLALAGHLLRAGRGVPEVFAARAGPALPAPTGARRERVPIIEIAMRSSAEGARVWFDPLGLLVRPGTIVRWVLLEGVHTTTSYHPANGALPRRMPETARPWDSGYLTEAGAIHEIALEVEGVYDYFCRPHEAAGMVGRIVVASDAGAAAGANDPDPLSPWENADEGVSPAALDAFPSVRRILRDGAVHAEASEPME